MSKYTIEKEAILANGSVPLTYNWYAGDWQISAGSIAVGSGSPSISSSLGGGIVFRNGHFYGWNGSALVSLDSASSGSSGGGGIASAGGPVGSIQIHANDNFLIGYNEFKYLSAGPWGTKFIGISGTLGVTSAISADSLELNDYFGQTAWANQTESEWEYNNATRVFTIRPTGSLSAFSFFVHGKRITKPSASITVPDQSNVYFIYFDANGNLKCETTIWDFKQHVPVIYLFYNKEQGKVIGIGEERHGVTMDSKTHEMLHNTVGTRFFEGLSLSGNTDGNGSKDVDVMISVENGIIYDEDLRFEIKHHSALSAGGESTSANPIDVESGFELYQYLQPAMYIPVFYLSSSPTGTDALWFRKDPVDKFPVITTGSSRGLYNTTDSGKWILEEVPNGDYFATWIFATNNVQYPIVAFIGQRVDGRLRDAKNNNKYENLNFGMLPFQEWKLLYRLIYQTRSSYGNTVHCRLRDIQDLRNITNIPAGTYVATDHGVLAGLLDDDHPQYVNTDGSRPMLSAWNIDQPITATSILGQGISAIEANSDHGKLFVGKAGGTLVSPSAITVGQTLGEIGFLGYDGSDYKKGALFMSRATENWTTSASGGGSNFEFWIKNASDNSLKRKFMITSAGRIAIGTGIYDFNPSVAIDIRKDDTDTLERSLNRIFIQTNTSADRMPELRFIRCRGLLSAAEKPDAGDMIGTLCWGTREDGEGHGGLFAAISATVAGYGVSGGSCPGILTLGVTEVGQNNPSPTFQLTSQRWMNVYNCTYAPSVGMSNGGRLFVDSGALKYIGSSNTVTTLGPAEPHCPKCGRDMVLEFENKDSGDHLFLCIWCLIEEKIGEGVDWATIKRGKK